MICSFDRWVRQKSFWRNGLSKWSGKCGKFRTMHKHNKMIAVPKIYKEITSRRVLIMEWIDGTKLTNLEDVKQLGIDPNKMIDIGVQCSLEQLLEHGFSRWSHR